MSTTVNVICYKSKVLSNNEHPLRLRVCKDRKVKHFNLGISVPFAFWDFDKQKPKKNCPNRELLEKLISEKTKAFTEQILEFKATDREFTAATLMEKVNNPVCVKTVKELFDLYISRLKDANRLRYAQMYESTLTSLLAYNGHLNILFSDIDVAWLKKYEAWQHKQSFALNTIGTRFRHLRVVYNLAIEENIVRADYYPFKKFKVSKLNEQTAKRSITKEEIISILNYQGKSFYECLAVDVFTFAYLTAGINFADIARLTIDNVIDDRLVYKRKKTQKLIKIPLQQRAIDLIAKYKQDDSPYLFPILSTYHKTEQQKVNRVHKVYSHVSKHLKAIGEELKLPIKLTTYVSRHSFATNLKRSGVSTSIISECLGHSSEKITAIYLDSFENSQIDEAMKNLL
ncbi:site-specific integrase [Parabacteroides sp. 52]|uniref:site-specific integrase n=1 Tax=unclassified Parabacteroides TaxID=2649774 RepID=UPI0013D2D08E|nr:MULTISPECIES: site-specific integrase [unclassified Parabacteroides]MDH6535632.1 integrase [Parabacteroides sp. PM5-20]NDV56469.1 site-specific integrase [Parabacteroides sp. 52]